MPRPKTSSSDRGQMLPLMAILFVVLMGFAALAVDAGYVRYQHEVQQMATDSAAVAGAATLQYSSSSATVIAAATASATSNGFTTDSSHTVTVDYAPADGPFYGDTTAVEVIITATHPTLFEKVLGALSFPTKTRSVARYMAGPTACIYALGTGSSGGIVINSSIIDAPYCGMDSNSSYVANSSKFTLASIGVYGSITSNAMTYYQASPSPAVLATDPCSTVAGCDYLLTNPPSLSSCNYKSLTLNSQSSYTLNPGTYCNGTTINSSTVTLNPGVYVMGGGFTVNSSTLLGTGVTIVNVTGAETINSTSVKLTAPASGNTAGILFFQPSSNTSGATVNSTTESSYGLQGAMYFPTAPLTTNSTFSEWMLIIARSITINSSAAGFPVGDTPFPGVEEKAFLVE